MEPLRDVLANAAWLLKPFGRIKLRKVIRRTVFGHTLVLVEPQCFPKLDASGSKVRLVNTNLAGAEVHCPLNFRFSISHILLQGIKQVCAITGRSLPHPAQARLVIPEQAKQNRGRIVLPPSPSRRQVACLLRVGLPTASQPIWCGLPRHDASYPQPAGR